MIAAKAPKHVFLIDGSGFIFRAYHALPPMTRFDGTPVNAVFGFTKMLMKRYSSLPCGISKPSPFESFTIKLF